jgi:putative transposase
MAKTQMLSFPLRLPDCMQAESLRLLDESRLAINVIIEELWASLDEFAGERKGIAWKQVEHYLMTRSGHGSRQERCEMEQAGRILRAQATRKQVFQTILPLLTDELIKPAEGKRKAHKDYRLIKEKVSALRKALDDPDSYMAMTNVIEQACNHFLKNEAWPQTYEDLQPVPVMSVGQLTFAGDDGLEKGQTYRAKIDYVHMCDLVTHEERQRARLYLHLRAPSESGTWTWGQVCGVIELPESVVSRLSQGAMPQAPTLGEIRTDDGSRLAVLDLILEVPATYVNELDQECRVLGWDWGVRSLITVSILEKPEGDGQESYRQISRPVFLESGGLDGRQARLRREIDRLKACRERYGKLVKEAVIARVEHKKPLPAHFQKWQDHVDAYEARIEICWKKYEKRNRELAHLASNLLILLALLYDCRLICGENLTTLKTIGRGRGVRGRFRNWRNNSQVRGELWRVLRYKCYLLGIRLRDVEARGTTHTCPRCHQPAKTYLSPDPSHRKKADDWAPWLCCGNPECGWNGARDYAASLNIARLGMAYLVTYHQTKRYHPYRMSESKDSLKPASYTGAGAALLLRPQGITPRPFEGKRVYYAGWSSSIALRTSQPKSVLAILSTSRFRKRLLDSA